jgi:1,4-alpha-glucan branching enzyme
MVNKRFFKSNEECEVTFAYEAEDAGNVVLVTEANGWQPIEMARRKKDGAFVAKVRLPKASQFQYRLLVDDANWVNDPAADFFVANEYGSTNGVVDTTPSNN